MATTNRRTFLARTVAVGAAAGTDGARAIGRVLGANEKISCAVIGTGGRGGGLFCRTLADRGDTTLAAVCDPDANRLGAAADDAGKRQGDKPRAVDDFRRVLDDKSIDAVFVVTPHHWHAPIGVRALEAGKDLYIEKPASHVYREGQALVAAAKKHGRIVQHGTQMRSSAVTARAGEVIRSGVLGEIKTTKAWNVQRHTHRRAVPDAPTPAGVDYDRWLGPAPKRAFNPNRFHGNWQWYRDYGNGDIGNDGVHDIDLACFGLGVDRLPIRITAHGSRIALTGEREYPDNMMVTYQFDNNKVLIYEDRGWAHYGMDGFDSGNAFYGTKGYMIFSRRGFFQVYLDRKGTQGEGLRGDTGMDRHLTNFLDCVRTRKRPNADAHTAHLTCALVHLGETAYRTGRVLQFDPKTETVRDDDEANALLTKEYRAPWAVPGLA